MENSAVEWLVEQIRNNKFVTASEQIQVIEQAKEMESEQIFEHQLFIGKVTCIIGFDKTLELINESKLEILSFNSYKKIIINL